MAERTVSSEKR